MTLENNGGSDAKMECTGTFGSAQRMEGLVCCLKSPPGGEATNYTARESFQESRYFFEYVHACSSYS